MDRIKKWWLTRLGYKEYKFTGLMAALKHQDVETRQVQLDNGTWTFARPGDYIVFDFNGREYVLTPEQFERDYMVTDIQNAGRGIVYQMLAPKNLETLAKPYYVVQAGKPVLRWITYANGVSIDYTQEQFERRYGAVDHRNPPSTWNSLLSLRTALSRFMKWATANPLTMLTRMKRGFVSTWRRSVRMFTSTYSRLGNRSSSSSVIRSMRRYTSWMRSRLSR